MNILFILISLIFCFGGRINVSASEGEGEGEGEAVAIVTVIHPNAVTVTFDPVAGKIIESTQIQLKEKEDSSTSEIFKTEGKVNAKATISVPSQSILSTGGVTTDVNSAFRMSLPFAFGTAAAVILAVILF